MSRAAATTTGISSANTRSSGPGRRVRCTRPVAGRGRSPSGSRPAAGRRTRCGRRPSRRSASCSACPSRPGRGQHDQVHRVQLPSGVRSQDLKRGGLGSTGRPNVDAVTPARHRYQAMPEATRPRIPPIVTRPGLASQIDEHRAGTAHPHDREEHGQPRRRPQRGDEHQGGEDRPGDEEPAGCRAMFLGRHRRGEETHVGPERQPEGP